MLLGELNLKFYFFQTEEDKISVSCEDGHVRNSNYSNLFSHKIDMLKSTITCRGKIKIKFTTRMVTFISCKALWE